ncbi:MAG TPA: class I SAM-dependent methyltransferase [Ktedonobacterales bacterium]|jgi:ubiquinone/menaquinone biosynthesis C-methylase UbiE
MTAPKSYDLDQLNLDRETLRLREQARLAWPQESPILLRFGLQDGMSVLDLGCGPGSLTDHLLALLPHSQIIALDNEPALLARARQLLPQMPDDRLRFVQASVMDTGLPENSVDFALARFVFQHLSDPVGAAREALRILKPTGRFALIEVDEVGFPVVFDPALPLLEAMRQKSMQDQAARGGNRSIGRHLWRILRAAGFENLHLDAFVVHSDVVGLDGFRQALGLSSERLGAAMAPFEAAPEPLIMVVGFAACGQKT